jgi:hypothetical protein
MPVSWIEFQGQKILYCDFREHKTDNELLETLEEQLKAYQSVEGQLLFLGDFRGAIGTPRYMERVNRCGAAVFRAQTKCNALLGITGLKNNIAQSLQQVFRR